MFVKVFENACEALYECESLFVSHLHEGKVFALDMENKDGTIRRTWDVNASAEIYIMNREGKTIDTMMWQPFKKGPRD